MNEKWGLVLGRLLASVIFILSGAGKLMQFPGTAEMMAGKGIPLAKLLWFRQFLWKLAVGWRFWPVSKFAMWRP